MFNMTEAFLTKHVRNLATGEIEDTLDGVVHRAGIVLQARIEVLEHEYPNTVMFMYPQTLGDIRDFVGTVGANNNFDFVGRIPWVVTWTGVGQYTVVENASGFQGNTDGTGLCCHYRGVLQDGNSVIHNWRAPGL
ncbi:MAG: hypothetical protein K8R39_13280 [Arcobacteraceae bacterium]|nr:hypothetical protein [Arcobacteraceae bacterium]